MSFCFSWLVAWWLSFMFSFFSFVCALLRRTDPSWFVLVTEFPILCHFAWEGISSVFHQFLHPSSFVLFVCVCDFLCCSELILLFIDWTPKAAIMRFTMWVCEWECLCVCVFVKIYLNCLFRAHSHILWIFLKLL